ncbi:MAG: hypothetical protein ABI847_11435 [Anaerolineales bacterium]
MARAWTRKITPEAAQQLRAGYAAFGLPWYAAAADWQTEEVR